MFLCAYVNNILYKFTKNANYSVNPAVIIIQAAMANEYNLHNIFLLMRFSISFLTLNVNWLF